MVFVSCFLSLFNTLTRTHTFTFNAAAAAALATRSKRQLFCVLSTRLFIRQKRQKLSLRSFYKRAVVSFRPIWASVSTSLPLAICLLFTANCFECNISKAKSTPHMFYALLLLPGLVLLLYFFATWLACEKGVRKSACKSFGAHKLWPTVSRANKLQFILTELLV